MLHWNQSRKRFANCFLICLVCRSIGATVFRGLKKKTRSLCCITTCIIVSHQTKDCLEIILDRNCVVSHHYHHDHGHHRHGHRGHRDSILILDGPLKIFGACNFRIFINFVLPLTKISFSHQWSWDLKRSCGHSFEVLIVEPLVVLHEKVWACVWAIEC